MVDKPQSAAKFLLFKLDKDQVWSRIETASKEMTEELLASGQRWAGEMREAVKGLESRATSLAGYGAGVLSVLLGSVAFWAKFGSADSYIILTAAGLSAVSCNYFGISTLQLRLQFGMNDDGWLNPDYIHSPEEMKKFRVFALWDDLRQLDEGRALKAHNVRQAFFWLQVTVVFVALLLLQIVLIQLFRLGAGPDFTDSVQRSPLMRLVGHLSTFFLCAGALLFARDRSRRL